MNKVRIFFASSPEEFNADMIEIGDFFRRLNDCYLDRGLYFVLTTNADPEPETRGSTGLAIGGCVLSFFLFGAKISTTAQDDYESTLASSIKTGKPKVVTYFKEGGGQPSDAIEDLQERLEKDPDLFYHTYSHIDTLKLGVLMNIKRLDLNGVDIRLENGKAWQGGVALLSLDNVEMVAGYEDLERLKNERAELESAYYAAMTKYAGNPEEPACYDAYVEASNKHNAAIQNIRDIESRLYHMLEGMYEQTAQGRISRRQAESYKLIERGMLNEARMVLNFNAIVNESRHDEELVEQAAKRAQVNVNELMQLKDVNAALQDWESVEACLQEAARLEEKYCLQRKATVTYIEFICTQNRLSEAALMGEKLKHYYEQPGSGASYKDKADILNALSVIYRFSSQFDKSEEATKASLGALSSWTGGDRDEKDMLMAIVYSNLSGVYHNTSRYEDAIEASTAALNIRVALAKQNPDKHEEWLAVSYANTGAIYGDMGKHDEAIKYTTLARDIFVRIAVQKPDPYEDYLFICIQTLGNTYRSLHRFADAEEQYSEALNIKLKLAELNPPAHEPLLAGMYNEYGKLYFQTKRYPEAISNYRTAIELCKKVVKRDPTSIGQLLTKNYDELVELYVKLVFNRVSSTNYLLSANHVLRASSI